MVDKRKHWSEMNFTELLEVRLCDLRLDISGTFIEANQYRLWNELKRKNIRLKPHIWLSTEWFCPMGIPGIAVPFFLAHPKLRMLEKSMMLEVDGGTPFTCMKLLRHETGHALDNAFHLRKKKMRQKIFGLSSLPYPDAYIPMHYSPSHVHHLDCWYSQAHPDEDWAETFAEWLNPRSQWKVHYDGLPVLHKLEYVDSVMKSLENKKPLVSNKKRVQTLRDFNQTLDEFYRMKQSKHTVEVPLFYTRELTKLFSSSSRYKTHQRASVFLKREKTEMRRIIARWTGQYEYVINQYLNKIVDYCEAHHLYLKKKPAETKLDLLALVTAQATHNLATGKNWIAL